MSPSKSTRTGQRIALPFWAKLSLPAFVFGAAIVLVVGSVHAGISEQESAGARINVAGRQRTLNQQVHKEAMASVRQERAYEAASLDLLEASARALLEGGTVALGGDGEMSLDSAVNSEERAKLQEQLELAESARTLVAQLETADGAEVDALLARFQVAAAEFHGVANSLVLLMQERSRGELEGLGNRALFLALIALIAGCSATFWNVRGLTASFDEVGDAARSLAQGQLDATVEERETGPVGRMARDLNSAMDGIRASLGANRVNWDTIADERDKEGRVQSALLDQAPGGLIHADTSRRVCFVNGAAQALLRKASLLDSGRDPVGMSISGLLASTGIDASHLSDVSSLPWTKSVECNGHYLQLKASAIRGQESEVIGWLLTVEDETERAKREAATAEAAERERAQREELEGAVARVLQVVGDATSGDLSVRTGLDGNDPVDRVGSHLDRFLEDLDTTMSDLAGQVAELNSASIDLNQTSEALGTSAEEAAGQARAAAEASESAVAGATATAAGIQQVTVSIDEIATNAATAALIANEAVEVAAESDRLMQSLGARSQEIDDVIKVITSIASQTNLLALNATIEAARAGEAGKGFAVVASEVKGLATETSKATGEISGRIEAIQRDITAAIAAIENIGQIIGRIDETQTSIAATVEEQSVTAREMSRGVDDAARGTEGIRGAIDAVAAQAAMTADGSQKSKDVARVMGEAASRVDNIVRRYRSQD